MKKFLLASLLLCQTAAFADWLPVAQPIPEGTGDQVNFDVYTTYDAANQTTVATWANLAVDNSTFPFYAVFNGTSWITPGTAIPPGTSAGVAHNIIPVYDTFTQNVIATWSDFGSLLPFYAEFDGTSWTTVGTPIPIGTSTGVFNDVLVTYDAATQTVIASWADATSQLPYYAIFDGTTWTTVGTPIPVGTSAGVKYDINLIYDAANQTVIATWTDITSSLPYYAIFDGTTWTTAGTPILAGASTGVTYNVNLVYNPTSQTVIAAWGDLTDQTPYYSIFNGTTWTTTGAIPQGASSGVYQNVSMTYDSTAQTVIAAWSDFVTFLPFYSIFNGTSWTTAAAVPVAPSVGIDYDIILSFIPSTAQTLAVWANFPGTADPFFNLFASLAAPGSLTGSGCSLTFASQQVWINQLTWTPSLTLDVVAYNIYRNGVLIATVSADTFQYNDPVNTRGVDVYGVTSVSSLGIESAPIIVTLISRGSGRR